MIISGKQKLGEFATIRPQKSEIPKDVLCSQEM